MAACRGANMVFVVGSPRSGTTWLQRLLAAHPAVRTGQESNIFSLYVAPQLARWRREQQRQGESPDFRGGIGLGGYFDDGAFLDVLRFYVVKMLEATGLQDGELFLEKSPSHALVMREIAEVLPETRFVHIVRDPWDVVASMLAASRSWGRWWAPASARTAADSWVRHVTAARTAGGALGPERFVEVEYEALHAAPAEVLRQLASFLDLPWSDGAIAKAVAANTADAVRGGGGTPIPLYGRFARRGEPVVKEPDGFIRKAVPGEGRAELSVIQQWVVASRLRSHLGGRSNAPAFTR